MISNYNKIIIISLLLQNLCDCNQKLTGLPKQTLVGPLTVDRRFPRKDHYNQLEALVCVLEVPEHGLHTVCTLGILAEAGLTLDWHPSIPGDLPELICECSETGEERVILQCSVPFISEWTVCFCCSSLLNTFESEAEVTSTQLSKHYFQ